MSKRTWAILLFSMVLVVVLAGCAPGGAETGLSAVQPAEVNEENALTVVTPGGNGSDALGAETGVTDSTSQEDTGVGVVVDVTPLSESELAAQPPGQTEPGAGVSGSDQETLPGDGQTQPLPNGWTTYVDSANGFTVAYPADYVVWQADSARLGGLIPTPSQSVYLMSPTIAESAMSGTDAPDLEVRIFQSGPVTSVEDWLTTIGAVAAGDGKTLKPYANASLSGVEVCEDTMVVPNCSVFVAGGDRVYQLRWLNQEGEAMASTFTLGSY